MRRSSRVIATVLGLSLTLTACSGHSSLLPSAPGAGGQTQSEIPVKSAAAPNAPMAVWTPPSGCSVPIVSCVGNMATLGPRPRPRKHG